MQDTNTLFWLYVGKPAEHEIKLVPGLTIGEVCKRPLKVWSDPLAALEGARGETLVAIEPLFVAGHGPGGTTILEAYRVGGRADMRPALLRRARLAVCAAVEHGDATSVAEAQLRTGWSRGSVPEASLDRFVWDTASPVDQYWLTCGGSHVALGARRALGKHTLAVYRSLSSPEMDAVATQAVWKLAVRREQARQIDELIGDYMDAAATS